MMVGQAHRVKLSLCVVTEVSLRPQPRLSDRKVTQNIPNTFLRATELLHWSVVANSAPGNPQTRQERDVKSECRRHKPAHIWFPCTKHGGLSSAARGLFGTSPS
jgi:hypothetical protein